MDFRITCKGGFLAALFLCLVLPRSSRACVRTHIRTHKRNKCYIYLFYYIYIRNKVQLYSKEKKENQLTKRKGKQKGKGNNNTKAKNRNDKDEKRERERNESTKTWNKKEKAKHEDEKQKTRKVDKIKRAAAPRAPMLSVYFAANQPTKTPCNQNDMESDSRACKDGKHTDKTFCAPLRVPQITVSRRVFYNDGK